MCRFFSMILLSALLSYLLVLSQATSSIAALASRRPSPPRFGFRLGEGGISLTWLRHLQVILIFRAEEPYAVQFNTRCGYLSLELDDECVLHVQACNFDAIVEVFSEERPYGHEMIGLMAGQGRLVNRRVDLFADDTITLFLLAEDRAWSMATLEIEQDPPGPFLSVPPPAPFLFTQTLSSRHDRFLRNYTPDRIMLRIGDSLSLHLASSPAGTLLIEQKLPLALEVLVLRGELGVVDVWISGISLQPGDVLLVLLRGADVVRTEGCICFAELARQLNAQSHDLQAVQSILESHSGSCIRFYLATRIQATE